MLEKVIKEFKWQLSLHFPTFISFCEVLNTIVLEIKITLLSSDNRCTEIAGILEPMQKLTSQR